MYVATDLNSRVAAQAVAVRAAVARAAAAWAGVKAAVAVRAAAGSRL